MFQCVPERARECANGSWSVRREDNGLKHAISHGRLDCLSGIKEHVMCDSGNERFDDELQSSRASVVSGANRKSKVECPELWYMSSSAARRMGDTMRHHFLIMDRNPIEWSVIGFYDMGWIGLDWNWIGICIGSKWIGLD